MADINNNAFKDHFKEGEKALWVGKPGQFGLTDGVMKSTVLLRMVLSIVVGLALLGAYIAKFGGTDTFQPLIIVVIVALFGFLAFRPAMDRGALLKKTQFCVTDKRVMVAVGHRDIFELARTGLKAKVVEAEGGKVHVALGKCVDIPETKYRHAALSPKRGEGDMVTGFVLYNVESAVRDFFIS